MVLVKDEVLMRAKKGKKPTRFRFVKRTKKGALRIGFKKGEAVELIIFKEVKKK